MADVTLTSLRTGLFSKLKLTPYTAPVSLENGHMWYDVSALAFKARENGETITLSTTAPGYVLQSMGIM